MRVHEEKDEERDVFFKALVEGALHQDIFFSLACDWEHQCNGERSLYSHFYTEVHAFQFNLAALFFCM